MHSKRPDGIINDVKQILNSINNYSDYDENEVIINEETELVLSIKNRIKFIKEDLSNNNKNSQNLE